MILKGGSPAIHKMGDIGRKEDDFIRVHSEIDKQYIGNFEFGFGFIDVKFNKSDVRPCTKEEIDYLNTQHYAINNTPLFQYSLNYDGEFDEKEISNINQFQIDEIVMIKRTSGKWEEGKVIKVYDFGIEVEIDITDTFRGHPWLEKPQKGYKFIPTENFDTYLKKMKTCIE